MSKRCGLVMSKRCGLLISKLYVQLIRTISYNAEAHWSDAKLAHQTWANFVQISILPPVFD